jgi:hypothetical protein
MNDKQQFSIWYFFISLMILLLIQTYLLAPRPEVINYSAFKTLVKQNMVTDLAVSHDTISGNIKAEGVKQGLSEVSAKRVLDRSSIQKKAVIMRSSRMKRL